MPDRSGAFRRLQWALVHASVFAVTACSSPASAPRPKAPHPAEQAQPAKRPSSARVEGRCAIHHPAPRGYAIGAGDWLRSIHTVGPLGPDDARATFAPWPEAGVPAPQLARGPIRLLIEEGRSAPRAVVIVREEPDGHCVLGAWATGDDEPVELALRDHWQAPDDTRFVALIEVVAHRRPHPSLVVSDGQPPPAMDPQRSWVAFATDGERTWVAGADELDRYIEPRLVPSGGGVVIVDAHRGPTREARERLLPPGRLR